jgi:hypothetical protein
MVYLVALNTPNTRYFCRYFLSFVSRVSVMSSISKSIVSLFASLCVLGGAYADTADTVGEPIVGSAGVTVTVKEMKEASKRRSLAEVQSAIFKPPAPLSPVPAVPKPWRQNTVSLDYPPLDLSPSGVTPSTASFGRQFTGPTDSSPDTSAAVGPTQYILVNNNDVVSYNKFTGVKDGVLDGLLFFFWYPAKTPPVETTYASDPRIRFDPLSQRWFIMMIDLPGIATGPILPNRVMIAVSDGPTITAQSSFTFFHFQTDSAGDGSWADYPTLGIDANALYIGANMAKGYSVYYRAVYVVRKSSVLGAGATAGPVVATAFRQVETFSLMGVDNDDPAATQGYFISCHFSNALSIYRVNNPGGTPTLSARIDVSIPDAQLPGTVPHPGSAAVGATVGELRGLDRRLYSAQIRKGRLWTALHTRVDATGATTLSDNLSGGRIASRWYELQNLASTPSVAQSGTVFDNATTNPKSYFLPAIVVSGQGHAYMSVNSAGTANYIDAAVTQRFAGDPAGSMQAPVAYTASSTIYKNDANRWGDYVDAAIDPDDNMTAWVVHKFADLDGFANLRIAQVKAPPPPPALSALPNSIAAGQASVNVVITGSGITASAGQGFYDPGAGFAKRLGAAIPGGVTVNSVTYTSPTSLTLNISTVGTPTGNKNVTVTNPDGQSVTGPFVINVTAAPLTSQSITFPAVAAFSWYQASATLAATASSGLAVTYSVVSGPCTIAANLLTATQPGACVIATNQAGNTTIAAAAQQTQNVTVNIGPMLLDIDASNAATRYNAATDGVMILRYLAGFTGSALTLNSTGSSATRSTAQIATHLAALRPFMDVDGDGATLASTDGVLIVRYLLGLRGNTLVQGMKLGSTPIAQVEANIARLMP